MLPYDSEVLFALYARYVSDHGLAAAIVVICTLVALLPTLSAGARGGRMAAGLLAVGWIWIGLTFHLQYFATINFAAPLYGALFVLQGLLLIGYGIRRKRTAARRRQGIVRGIGALLTLFAVILYPLLDPLGASAAVIPRMVGLAPAPTALFTIGMLLLGTGRLPLGLLFIPVAWALVAGYSGWVLGLPNDLVMPLLATVGLLVAALANRPSKLDVSRSDNYN